MAGPLVEALLDDLERRHPRSLPGVLEARAVEPERFAAYAELFVGWGMAALGSGALPRMVDAFVRFSMSVNFAQARYEADGRYLADSQQQCWEDLYSRRETMDDYLWGVYLTNFLWAHHMELSLQFERSFLPKLSAEARLVELAPGHGGWGLLALHHLGNARLEAFDISPSSIGIATSLAAAAGLSERVRYRQGDVLAIEEPPEGADGAICSFLLEHLDEPGRLFAMLRRIVRDGGHAFVTAGLTAAQVDHVYEFRRESEVVLLAEEHGFRLLDLRSAGPRRTLRGARFLPRSVGMVLQKRVHETW